MTTPPEDTTETLDLPVDPHAPSLAGNHLHQVGEEVPVDVLDDVSLAISELVSNAVRHAVHDIRLVVSVRSGTLLIEVHDDGAALVRPHLPGGGLRPSHEDAEHGRGLFIVAALAERWGIEEAVPPPGKHVWLEVRLPAGPDPPHAS